MMLCSARRLALPGSTLARASDADRHPTLRTSKAAWRVWHRMAGSHVARGRCPESIAAVSELREGHLELGAVVVAEGHLDRVHGRQRPHVIHALPRQGSQPSGDQSQIRVATIGRSNTAIGRSNTEEMGSRSHERSCGSIDPSQRTCPCRYTSTFEPRSYELPLQCSIWRLRSNHASALLVPRNSSLAAAADRTL